jgi:hypothetical protein
MRAMTGAGKARDEGFCRGLVERRHLLDVGAADQALFALAGQHQHADGAVGRELLQAGANGIDDIGPQDVERAGIADGEADDIAVVAVDTAMRIEHVHGAPGGVLGRAAHFRAPMGGLSRPGPRPIAREIDAAFSSQGGYYMTGNIP